MDKKYTFDDFVNIIRRLRSPDGCPWDMKQTHLSIRQYLIEEVYELIDEIESGDMNKVCDELGDLLLQIVFHAQIAKDTGSFTIDDVIDGVCRKMISRHVHVFGDISLETPEEVLINWDKIKKSEKGQISNAQALFDVPAALPALAKSMKVQQKAARVGFDWKDINDVFDKLTEEIQEVKAAILKGNQKEMEDETGDMLFAAVNISRFIGVHPEIALNKAAKKFIDRFAKIEQKAHSKSKNLDEMSLEELDSLWEEVKAEE